VTATTQDTDKLRELEDGTRRAWKAYSAKVRDLRGEEYERVERDSWAELQHELRRLEQQRRSSSGSS
jgi:hypothetical protein